MKPIIEERAKEQQRTQTQQGYQKSDKAVHTTVELAKTAGVSHDTIHKVEKIEEKAPEEVKRQLSSGEISINKAYTNIKNQEKKEELKARVEEVAEEFEKDE